MARVEPRKKKAFTTPLGVFGEKVGGSASKDFSEVQTSGSSPLDSEPSSTKRSSSKSTAIKAHLSEVNQTETTPLIALTRANNVTLKLSRLKDNYTSVKTFFTASNHRLKR